MGRHREARPRTPFAWAADCNRLAHLPEGRRAWTPATRRGIAAGDWVSIETPTGAMRARALLNANIDRRVVVGEHGWWRAAPEANAPGYDPFSPQGSNYNLTVDPTSRDPISGTSAHRSGPCEVSLIA
jgi:anaerobic selenocysteine-containing dehydrogenase